LLSSGGILVAWRSASWPVSSSNISSFSVSIKLKPASGGLEWWLTGVYGLAHDADKAEFLAELHDLRLVRLGPLILLGDFNMIFRSEDKNNGCLNGRLMGQFHHFIDDAALN
jgi:hypothetical protein